MFVREKRINGYTYLYLVETVREDGRAKQRIIKNLGRKEVLAASGALERLASSVVRYAERAVVLAQIEAGNRAELACKRIGPPLLFGRLWEETGCRAVIEDLLSGRSFEFAVERSSPPCCTGSWSPARTGPVRSGWPTMTSLAWTGWGSITSTARWPGWARNSPQTSRAAR